MDIIYEIRRRHLVQKQSISAIAREMGISRLTVRKFLKELRFDLTVTSVKSGTRIPFSILVHG